jgi:tRNA-specific 2-thiouridylase
VDGSKDQTYFLWGIDREVVPRMLLPVGHQTKAETREVARSLGLIVADKVESQDICFVPDGDHTKIIRQRLGADAPALARGPILLEDGRVVVSTRLRALHDGQRRGFPLVCRTDVRGRDPPEARAVVIGPRGAARARRRGP